MYNVDLMTPKELAAQICGLGFTVTEIDGMFVTVAVQLTPLVKPLGIALQIGATGKTIIISPEGMCLYTCTKVQ